MKFRYVTEKLNQNGSTESAAAEFQQSDLLVGRGGSSHLILSHRSVSLVHAKISRQNDRLVVEDQGSLAGIRVNGKRLARSDLVVGDTLQIGDVKLSVTASTPDEVTLTQQVVVLAQVSEEQIIARQRSALALKSYFPSMRLLSLFLAFVVAVFFFFLPMLGSRTQSWSSGPISNSHKMIEGDCAECHSDAFSHVQDKDCIKCHNVSDHAKDLHTIVAHRPDLNAPCSQCHMEHNGDAGLINGDPRLCINCHGDLQSVKKDSTHQNVASFDSHPEFRIDVKSDEGKIERVSIDDKSKALDTSQLKLNHALHLKAGLRGKDGPMTLHCSSCHSLTPDLKTVEPINFEKHCSDCHTLGFDQRIPDARAPHGDDEGVYPALFTEYTKLLLLNGESEAATLPTEGFQRTLPGGTGVPAVVVDSANVSSVVDQAREAEKQLFTKTACYVCHNSAEKPKTEQTATNSHFHVVKPEVPTHWLKKSIFDHGAHEEVSCESCHQGTRTSSKTTDVLLPSVKSCRDCHLQESKQGFVKSDCMMCHSYHDALGFPYEKKKSIADYLSLIQGR